jgi:hypothetical protein
MLTAELLVLFVIVAIRIVADFSTTTTSETQSSSGNSTSATVTKGNVLHPSGQLGPLPILCGAVITWFVLSFVAMGGGLRAKLAVIMGAAIVITLGVKSIPEIEFAGGVIGKVGTVVVPPASGTGSISSANATSPTNTPSSTGSTTNTAGDPVVKSTTATTNALGAASRAASNLVKNFLPDLTGSFDITNPSKIISSTSQQWGDLTKTLADLEIASDDAAALAAKDVAGQFSGNPVSNFVNGLKGDLNILKGLL